MVNMTFQTRPEAEGAAGDVRLWLLMASEIATQASFNFGTSDFASATLGPRTKCAGLEETICQNNHKIKQHPYRSFPLSYPR